MQSEEEARIISVYEKRPPGRSYTLFKEGELFMQQSRERAVLKILKQSGFEDLKGKNVLDVGCGTGTWIRDFIRWGARPELIIGIDLVKSRIEKAKEISPGSVRFLVGSAASLPIQDSSQDIVLQSTVFTSILDPDLKFKIASEMLRVAKKDGIILWYDFAYDNPKNSDVKGIGLGEIRELFSNHTVTARRITLAPPIARRLARLSWLACEALYLLPFLRTHLLCKISKAV